jgi:predicted transcriptional regulator of viral defense system
VARSLSVARALQIVGRPVFTTREIAAIRKSSVAATSQILGRMQRDGLLARAARGLWCVPEDPRFTTFALVPFLAGEHRAYVSFLSALHLHGMIEQIPRVVYAATTAHTRSHHTPLGTFSFHRIDPRFFAGFDWYGQRQGFLIATREKALVDCLYLSSRRGRRFGTLPGIELGRGFRARRAREWIRKIPDPRIRLHASERLRALLTGPAPARSRAAS